MRTSYQINNGVITDDAGERNSILIFVAPDSLEKRFLTETLRLDSYDIESALDPDEVSRIEVSADRVSIIWKQPKNAILGEQVHLEVSSMGLFLQEERLVIIMSEGSIPFSAKEFQRVSSLADFMLRFLLHTVRHYVGHLKVIKQLSSVWNPRSTPPWKTGTCCRCSPQRKPGLLPRRYRGQRRGSYEAQESGGQACAPQGAGRFSG